jgi:hypothetical protein
MALLPAKSLLRKPSIKLRESWNSSKFSSGLRGSLAI